MSLSILAQFDMAHLFYISLIVSGILFAEAAYVLLADNNTERKRINRRMMAAQNNAVSQKDVLVQLRKERGLDADGNFVLPMRWLNRLIVQAGIKTGIGQALAVWAGFAVFATAFVLFITGSLIIAILSFPVQAILIPVLYLRMRRSRKLNLFGRQLPEAIDLITRSLKAGHPVPVAISMVAREMPDPIGSEFGMIADEVTYGSDLVEALLNMYQRVGHPDLPLLVSSVSIQSTTGGNLREILSGLSQVIRDRLKMKAKIRAISAEGRISAIFLTAMPVMLVIALLMIVPGYYKGIWIYTEAYMFAGGLCFWLVVGNLMILKMVSFRI
jgi:tight adherence protein B